MPVVSGVDYSWARPTVASLQAAGVTWVGRYLGPPSWGKTITQPEYDALVGAGIEVGLVFENGPDDWQGGENAGVANAHLALQYVPTGYAGPIWCAVDTAVDPPAAIPYVRGFAAAIGSPGRTGVYGEGGLIVLAHDLGIATAPGWQSASTSFPGNAATTPDTGIQQGLGGPVAGTDADTVVGPLAATPAPTPPAPTPAPAPVNQEDSVLTDAVTYRPGQIDMFGTVPPGGIVHFWSTDDGATWGNEVLCGPLGGKGNVVATFAGSPVARVANGSCQVFGVTTNGATYLFVQGQPAAGNGWEAHQIR